MSGATPWGSEFVLGMPSESSDRRPAVATLPDGRFLVTWHDDDGLIDILARTNQPDGGKVGDTFIVNPTTSFQTDPSIAMLTDGRFVIAWVDWGGAEHVSLVRAQMFNADGTRLRGEFLVNANTDGTQNEPAVTALADGRFVIAWTDTIPSPADPDTRLHAQVFNSDGTRSGGEFRVDAPTPLRANDGKLILQEAGRAIDGSRNSGTNFLIGDWFANMFIGGAGNDRDRYCVGEVRTALAA